MALPEMSGGLVFKPVTAARWADFEALFEAPGGPKYCWCMAWRATPDERREASRGAARKPQMAARILSGEPVGLLGYADGAPTAWVSVAPRDTYRDLGGPPAGPDENIWSLACMYIPRRLRGSGVGRQLVSAAIEHARANRAAVLEAYPVAPDSPSYRFMGFVPAFEKLGFVAVGPAGSRRTVMRFALDAA